MVCWILPEFKLRKDKYYIVEELKQSLMNILSLSLFVELSKIQKIRHGSSFTTVDGVLLQLQTIAYCIAENWRSGPLFNFHPHRC